MAISDDKTSFSFVMDKSLKHKLDILGDADSKKIGPYIAQILEEYVIDFEQNILDTFGIDEFTEMFTRIFGEEYEPHLDISSVSGGEQKKRLIQGLKQNISKPGIRKIVPNEEYGKKREIWEMNRK